MPNSNSTFWCQTNLKEGKISGISIKNSNLAILIQTWGNANQTIWHGEVVKQSPYVCMSEHGRARWVLFNLTTPKNIQKIKLPFWYAMTFH